MHNHPGPYEHGDGEVPLSIGLTPATAHTGAVIHQPDLTLTLHQSSPDLESRAPHLRHVNPGSDLDRWVKKEQSQRVSEWDTSKIDALLSTTRAPAKRSKFNTYLTSPLYHEPALSTQRCEGQDRTGQDRLYRSCCTMPSYLDSTAEERGISHPSVGGSSGSTCISGAVPVRARTVVIHDPSRAEDELSCSSVVVSSE
ncbi:hypothetical protein PVAG01_04647 [Phlyctema vagabunda]|uniref:Uncharacterized protein n=1 Tax=Phlyctema vagabunda TaxID=108571 RepID=A0ABR4PHY4_9HELO